MMSMMLQPMMFHATVISISQACPSPLVCAPGAASSPRLTLHLWPCWRERGPSHWAPPIPVRCACGQSPTTISMAWPGTHTTWRGYQAEVQVSVGELDTSVGGLWSGPLLKGRGLSMVPVVFSCSSSLSCVLLRRGGQFVGGCGLSHWGRLRHWWQHSHASFLQWDIWT